MPGPALVVGLGNPGPEYERTRHNLGFRVIDVLADRLGARVKPAKGMRALVAEARDGDARIILAKPTTFMNASGAAVTQSPNPTHSVRSMRTRNPPTTRSSISALTSPLARAPCAPDPSRPA